LRFGGSDQRKCTAKFQNSASESLSFAQNLQISAAAGELTGNHSALVSKLPQSKHLGRNHRFRPKPKQGMNSDFSFPYWNEAA
jgi:hypothetical protein